MKGLAAFPVSGAEQTIELSSGKVAAARRTNERSQVGLILHCALWALLVGVFLFRGAPVLLPEITRSQVGPVDSLHTINLCLQATTGSEGSPQFFATLSALPRTGRVVIFMGRDVLDSLLGMAVSYLVWPREVQIISGDEKVATESLAKIRPDSVGAVIFCKVKPPAWFPAGVDCAPGVRVVCLKRAESEP